MPPKRGAPASSGAAPKKPRAEGGSSNNNDNEAEQLPAIPRSKRWSAVSGSGNLDDDYKLAARDPVKAYKYICLCQPPFSDEDDETEENEGDGWEDEEEDDDDDDEHETVGEVEENKRRKARCDGGKTCICNKPAEEQPDHPWKLTFAAKRKFFNQLSQCDLRDPDNFGMYTYNDHASYGVLETFENLILDFEEAADNLDEKWVICETLGYFIPGDHASIMFRIDDGERAQNMCLLLGRLFLSMLARLEREGLLGPDSRIKNLGTIMGLWMLAAKEFRGYECLDGYDQAEEPLGPKQDKKHWQPWAFDRYILAYARKYGIELSGPKGIASLIKECDEETNEEEFDFPDPAGSNAGPGADPFGFFPSLKKYKSGGKIGGDKMDITTFSSKERRDAAFDKKDPLSKRERDAIKDGLVFAMG